MPRVEKGERLHFDAKIREIRELFGFRSDEELAAAIGKAQSYISRWKNAKQGPSSASLKIIADKLNVSADWLIDRQECAAGLDFALLKHIALVLAQIETRWKRETGAQKLARIAAIYDRIYALSKAGKIGSSTAVQTAIMALLQTGKNSSR